jgi:hypothetical protein
MNDLLLVAGMFLSALVSPTATWFFNRRIAKHLDRIDDMIRVRK